MDDREFFDLIYTQWAATTGAENQFWMPELHEESGRWTIYAVDQEQVKTPVSRGLTEVDADFITGLHGCFGDLVRRLHDAVDESDRLDLKLDDTTNDLAELATENSDLKSKLETIEEVLRKTDQDLIKANADVEYYKNEANSHDWRNG